MSDNAIIIVIGIASVAVLAGVLFFALRNPPQRQPEIVRNPGNQVDLGTAIQTAGTVAVLL